MSSDAPSLRESERSRPVAAGDEFYEVWVNIEDGKVELEHWIVSVVRGETAYAIRKTPHTWVKVSKTNGDYGWAPNIDAYNRRRFSSTQPPAAWSKSKSAAYSKALPDIDAAIRSLTKLRAQITGQRTKQRNAKARKSPGTRKDGASPQTTTSTPSQPPQGGDQ